MNFPSARASAASILGSEDAPPTHFQRSGALAVCGLLAVATIFAAYFGSDQGPQSTAFVTITATIWSLADLLTAFLLMAQFYANGNVFIGLTASAYLITGMLTCPYILAFPGIVYANALRVADEQTSIYLWLFWHATFAALILCANYYDLARGPLVSRERIKLVAILGIALPIVLSCAISALLFVYRENLPNLLVHGLFQPLYLRVFVPIVIALNLAACAAIVRRRTGLTPLAICISIAAFSGTLDSFLNMQTGWYTYAWDAGKLLTVFTATVVLFMILCDIAGVYGRLARVAKIDVLTSLHNRRAFDEYFAIVFKNARRLRRKMCVLMIDVDFFKKFNDSYGHQAGDECLRQVARAMAACVHRPLDLVARYGGEEFVVVLSDTPLAGAFVVSETIRQAVEGLEIAVATEVVHVSVSIGIGFISDASRFDEARLFSAADRGVYEAKERGRNRVVLGTAQAMPRSASPPLSDAVASHAG